MEIVPLFSQELEVAPRTLLWLGSPEVLETCAERILRFESRGGRSLTLVSNYPYELWLDGVFIGDGGHRCTDGEALADYWELATEAKTIQVRLHWLDLNQTDVLYRCLFPDPFFAEISSNHNWTCFLDNSVQFAAPASAQLPRQNILILKPEVSVQLTLQPASLSRSWKIIPSPIKQARYLGVNPKLYQSQMLKAQQNCNLFCPEMSENVALYVREQRPCDLQCDTYDLGQIALHRFEVTTSSSACVLYYSEVANFEEVASNRFRAKVQLADAIGAGLQAAAPFGQRGCRYVHVLYPTSSLSAPTLQVWRREYPLQWRSFSLYRNTDVSRAIITACRANLVACIDGGTVDTCWRERAQWTGDLRMSALALRALTHNLEVIDLALHQIAQSYNPEIGLVNAVWPALHPDGGFQIPHFHLAFCLAALEQDSHLQRDPLVRQVVLDSFATWQQLYQRDGLIQGMPGWYFTDWDYSDLVAMGRDEGSIKPHAVCNAWWNEWCDQINPEAAISPDRFDQAFWMGQAYALTPDKTRDSPHATAAALNNSAGQHHVQEGLVYLQTEMASGRLTTRVTPYFAFFVAQALSHHAPQSVIPFIEEFYGTIAQKYGSLYEKTSDEASLAHGWSVAIAALLVQPS
jgi:hypothetical protein